MTRPFDPRKALRQISNLLLKEFFYRRGRLQHVPWQDLSETRIEPIFEAWQGLPDAERQAVQVILQDIHALADERALGVLAEQIQQRHPEKAGEFTAWPRRYDRAMWAYLRVPGAFDEAALFARADALSTGRYWATHNSLPREPLALSEQNQETFRRALSDFYWRRQMRGSCAVVEHHRRLDDDDYFFVYLDDYPDSRMVFNDAGQMETRTDRYAFDNVFVFSPAEGSLSLYAKGGRQIHAPLRQTFCKTLLGMAVDPSEPARPAYQLDHLLDPGFQLTANPADQVAEARILALGLEIRDQPRRRILLQADPAGPGSDIYNMLGGCLSLPATRLRVRHAKFRLTFLGNGHGRGRTLTFSVSHPCHCDLRSKPDLLQAVGRRCLKLWGVLVDG